MQNSFSSLYKNTISNFKIIYESNNWPRNPTNNFPLKKFLFVTVKSIRNALKSQFAFNGSRIEFDGEGSRNFGNEFSVDVIIFLLLIIVHHLILLVEKNNKY